VQEWTFDEEDNREPEQDDSESFMLLAFIVGQFVANWICEGCFTNAKGVEGADDVLARGHGDRSDCRHLSCGLSTGIRRLILAFDSGDASYRGPRSRSRARCARLSHMKVIGSRFAHVSVGETGKS
jgi:hypothetical protein